MRLPTASALDRAAACAGGFALPQLPHVGAATAYGSVVHRYLERLFLVGREAALAEIADADDRARCAAIDTSRIPPDAEREVAFAYDPASDRAERLRLDGPRGYPDDGRIYGTADLVGLLDGRAWVADYKTGARKVSARDAMQLRFLALACARVAGLDEAHVEMLYLGHDGSWFVDAADLDPLDLEATRAELLEIQSRVGEARRVVGLGGLPQLVPGVYCEHCGAAAKCPAQERQQAALVERAPSDLTTWIAELPEEEAGRIVEQAITVGKLAEKVREAANERVGLRGDLALPSGRRLSRVAVKSQVKTPEAKERLAKLTDELRESGLIVSESTWQFRVVGTAKKKGG